MRNMLNTDKECPDSLFMGEDYAVVDNMCYTHFLPY